MILLLFVLGWVGFGPIFSTCWVGLGQSADGLGWVGSGHNNGLMDNCVVSMTTVPLLVMPVLLSQGGGRLLAGRLRDRVDPWQ